MSERVGWHEAYAGFAACALRVLDRGCRPFANYLGSKRRFAPQILAVGGVKAGSRLRVRLSDAGPAGEAWAWMRTPERVRAVARVLDGWAGHNPFDLWDNLVAEGLPDAPGPDRYARWLWVQARSANSIPVWHDKVLGWRMGDKARMGGQKHAVQRGDWRRVNPEGRPVEPAGDRVRQKGPGTLGRCRGMVYPGTISLRLRRFADALEGAAWEASHGTAARCAPRGDLDGWVSFLDPPYRGKTGYPVTTERRQVLAFGRRLFEQRSRVIISEAEPLPLDGWHHVQLAPGEWLTCSFPPCWRPAEQIPLVELPALVETPRRERPSRPPPAPPLPVVEQLDLFSLTQPGLEPGGGA